MPFVDYVDPEDTEERTRELLAADADYYGRPSLFARAMANDPGAFAARRAYHRQLVDGGPLATRTCELVYLAVSVTNDCEYCVASHREQLVERTDVPDEDAAALARGDHDQFEGRERAAVAFAAQVAREPQSVDGAHHGALREAGFDDDAVVRLVAVAAAAVAANAIADALGVDPTDRVEPFATGE
jgi:uncharacterized peroxidase-related enzyme